MKKRIIVISLAVAAVLIAVMLIFTKLSHDPNYMIKHSAVRLTEGKGQTATYDCGHFIFLADQSLPVFMFIPAEDGEYVFDITDIRSETDDVLIMSVVDRKFSDLITANNTSDEDGSVTGSISDKTFLQKKHKYYIFTDASSDSGRIHKGSFRISVNRSAEDIRPAEVTTDEKVRIRVRSGEQESVLFVPEESGYYRFNTSIVSKNASAGFSSVSDVTAADGDQTIPVTDGICFLEAGTEYYVQVSIDEIRGNSAKVDVKCRMIGSSAFDEEGIAELENPAMIDYTADESGLILFRSESDGNPKVSVYDSEGLPLRSDDDSGEEFGGSSKDFAVVIDAEKGQKYHVFVNGKFKKCIVSVSPYTDEPIS